MTFERERERKKREKKKEREREGGGEREGNIIHTVIFELTINSEQRPPVYNNHPFEVAFETFIS
jgi:hypothetical protein